MLKYKKNIEHHREKTQSKFGRVTKNRRPIIWKKKKLSIGNLDSNENELNDDALNNTLTFIVSYDEHLTNAKDSTSEVQ